MNSGLETLGGHIQELVKLLRARPQGTAIPAAMPVSEGATETGTPPYAGSNWCSGSWRSSDGDSWKHWDVRDLPVQAELPLPERYGIHQFRRSAIAWIGSWCPCHNDLCHLRRCQCRSLWRSVRNSRMGRDQVLPFRSRHRASVWASLPEMRERGYRGHCHRQHTVLKQIGGITSLWAPPQGLGMIRDGNSQFRRIY